MRLRREVRRWWATHTHRSTTPECEITQIRREQGQANTIGKGEMMEEKEWAMVEGEDYEMDGNMEVDSR